MAPARAIAPDIGARRSGPRSPMASNLLRCVRAHRAVARARSRPGGTTGGARCPAVASCCSLAGRGPPGQACHTRGAPSAAGARGPESEEPTMKMVRAEETVSARQTHREGRIDLRGLIKGDPASSNNFEWSLVRMGEDYKMPRHRHNIAQIIMELEGEHEWM